MKWLYLDLNSYFASVEQADRPELRGRPVAVVPMATDSTCAIAASYEAKAFGVKTGTKIYEARRICPELVCVLARHDRYVRIHHRILEIAARHIPIDRVCSIDEIASRLPPGRRNKAAASDLARRIKADIAAGLSPAITCSIGVAPNAFLAKVATDLEKPDGLVLLAEEDLPGPLFGLALTDLPGINVRMAARLARAGVESVEDLWNLAPRQARAVWGSVGGERFWYRLRGHDIPEQDTQRRVIGHSRVLDPALRTPPMARLVLRRLTVKAASRLRREGFYATLADFSTRTADGVRWGGTARVPPSQDNRSFLEAVDRLWAAMTAEIRPQRLRKVSVTLHGLCRREETTGDLFAPAPSPAALKSAALSRVMDQLNARFGSDTVHLGVSPKTSAGYVGTKIAFSRIPDEAEFFE